MMSKKLILIPASIIILLIAAVYLFVGEKGLNVFNQAKSECLEVKQDLEYRCPYSGVNENDDILLSQFKILFSAKIDGSGQKNIILHPPKDWGIMQNSISPNHERLLLTMVKDSCPKDWSKSEGRSCSWGRQVIWAAYHERNDPTNAADDVWVLRNLAALYGFNADIHGWTSWQSNKYALFNGIIRPEGQSIHGDRPEDNNAQAYQIKFDSNENIHIGLWGEEKIYREDCLTGRLHASQVQNQDACVDGAQVVYARRCYSEPVSAESFAWWNTKNIDGSGGKCVADEPTENVPVLRVFVTDIDVECQPKTAFDINKPIQQPRSDGLFRHLSKAVPEWGDMQPSISKDGQYVSFHTVKGYDDSNPEDNCGSFRHDGEGVSRVFYCELNENQQCINTELLTAPGNFRFAQGQPFFYEGGDGKFILIIEDIIEEEGGSTTQVVKVRIDKEPHERTVLFEGIGGYLLK